MESALGANNGELSYGLTRASLIYTQYFDVSDGCPEDIRRLVSTIKDLHDVLKESEALLVSWNRAYPGQAKLNQRLVDVETFVRKYCVLVEPSTTAPDGSPPYVNRSWTALQYAFEKRRAIQLHQSLLMEVQRFIQFILVLSLRINDSMSREVNREHRGRIEPANSTVEDIAKRLSDLKYQVERRQIQISQRSPGKRRALDLSDLEDQLGREWRLLCLRAGFEDHDHRPPLPSSAHTLLTSSTQIYHDMIIAHNRDTMVSPMRDSLDSMEAMSISSPALPPSIQQGKRLKRKAKDDSPPTIDSSEHHAILGDPALPLCAAEFEMRPRQMLKLQTWKMAVRTDHRVITWVGTKTDNILEHFIPSTDVVPYSLHSSLRGAEKGLSLTFHGASRIRWLKSGNQKLMETRSDVKYLFVESDDFKKFQEEFRDMYLIDTFDVETIRTEWSKGRLEAVNQDLKIWRSRDDDTFTISFFANHIREHLEFSLDWLEEEFELQPDTRTVKLTFSVKAAKGWKASLRRHMIPHRKRSIEESNTAEQWVSVGLDSPRGSVSTVSSSSSSIGPSPGRIAEMVAWTEKMRHLTIQFSPDDPSARGEEDGYTRFYRRIDKIMKAQRNLT